MAQIENLKKEIKEIITKSPLEFDPVHSDLTLKWVLKLKSDADEALQIAALAHDIERAVTGILEKDLDDYSKINEFKQEHAIRSADITADLLKKHQYDDNIIGKVKNLIINHEIGGDEESDILKDADSIAYFDYNIKYYHEKCGDERTKGKIKFMYKRMSDQSKEIVKKLQFSNNIKKLFKEAIEELK